MVDSPGLSPRGFKMQASGSLSNLHSSDEGSEEEVKKINTGGFGSPLLKKPVARLGGGA